MKQLIYILIFMMTNFIFSQNFEPFYGETLRSKIKIIENDDMIKGEVMHIKINKYYVEVSVESEIKEEFCAEIQYPLPAKLNYRNSRNRLIIANESQEKNGIYTLVSLKLRNGKIFGKVRIDGKIEKFEFK